MNGVDSFGGMGATLVDSLDTLFIMGLDVQFKKATELLNRNLGAIIKICISEFRSSDNKNI